MERLTYQDIRYVISKVPSRIKKLMDEKEWVGRIVISGGFIRSIITGEKPNDIDLFVPDEQSAELLAYKLADDKNKVIKTQNAYTVINAKEVTIQIIKRWTFNNAESVINSFDFTVCAAAVYNCVMVPAADVDRKSEEKIVWRSVCHPSFYADLAAKRLVYTKPIRNEDAGGSLLRVLKYYQKGFRIPLDSFGAVIARLMQSVNMKAINEHHGTKEAQLAKVITGLLREVDPNVDPLKHSAHLPLFIEGDTEPTKDEDIVSVEALKPSSDS